MGTLVSNYINGELKDTIKDDSFCLENPATGEVINPGFSSPLEDVEAALAASWKIFDSGYSATASAERAAYVDRMADYLDGVVDDMASSAGSGDAEQDAEFVASSVAKLGRGRASKLDRHQIRQYLSSGKIRGVGPARAARLVAEYGTGTLEVLGGPDSTTRQHVLKGTRRTRTRARPTPH